MLDHEIRVPPSVTFTVTDLVMRIGGVNTLDVWDQDFTNRELVETELAFLPQYRHGTVWHLGGYPEEWKGATLVEKPGWIAGIGDAGAGISVHAEPSEGTSSYAPGWAAAVDRTDRRVVFDTRVTDCVPAGSSEDVLIIDEFNFDEPRKTQVKYYPPGVGNIRVDWKCNNDDEQEVLELIDLIELDDAPVQHVRKAALQLEVRTTEGLPDVYGKTSPAGLAMTTTRSPCVPSSRAYHSRPRAPVSTSHRPSDTTRLPQMSNRDFQG